MSDIHSCLFVRISLFWPISTAMTSEISKKLTEIETLYSEQEYTIHTLNDIVTRQDKEISRLSADLQWLKLQLLELKEQIPDAGMSSINEVPPHY
ncbi:MAG: SlyX family protein [Gammaproteobacteria bacterium]|nr:SlyX family protein [Gammaproteobacteria bacterium]